MADGLVGGTEGATDRTVSVPLAVPVDIVYQDAEDGWIMVSVPQVPGALGQGRTRAEARANVRDALRELLLARAQELTGDTLTLTIAL